MVLDEPGVGGVAVAEIGRQEVSKGSPDRLRGAVSLQPLVKNVGEPGQLAAKVAGIAVQRGYHSVKIARFIHGSFTMVMDQGS